MESCEAFVRAVHYATEHNKHNTNFSTQLAFLDFLQSTKSADTTATATALAWTAVAINTHFRQLLDKCSHAAADASYHRL